MIKFDFEGWTHELIHLALTGAVGFVGWIVRSAGRGLRQIHDDIESLKEDHRETKIEIRSLKDKIKFLLETDRRKRLADYTTDSSDES